MDTDATNKTIVQYLMEFYLDDIDERPTFTGLGPFFI